MFSLVPFDRSRSALRPFSLDRFFDEPFFQIFDRELSVGNLPVEVSESDKEIIFSVEVPGIEEKDLHVSVEDGLLTFSGERSSEREEGTELIRRERWYGKFSRSFRLPKHADLSKISADLKNGVLKVTVPKKEEGRNRRVEVKVC